MWQLHKKQRIPYLLATKQAGDLRDGGTETGPCLGWQVNPLLASLTSPFALKQQIQGSGM